MRELSESEQEIIKVLRNLPLAIIITQREGGKFAFQCLDGNGTAPTLASAIGQGVSYLTGYLAGDETIIKDLRSHNRP